MAKSRPPKKAAEAPEAAEPKAAARKKAAPPAKAAAPKAVANKAAAPKKAAEPAPAPAPKAKVAAKAAAKPARKAPARAEPAAEAPSEPKAAPKAESKAEPKVAEASPAARAPRGTKAPARAAAPRVAAMLAHSEPPEPERHPSMRLHKFLAHGGAGSRREAETFIDQGRVSVNGKVVTQMGFKVDPQVDRVLLDGEPVKSEKRFYYQLHKPAGFVCTNKDEVGRPRAVDLLRGVQQRVYTVGRLDVDSLGLILVTNDGDLANVVCHPRYRIQKRYQVAVKGFMTRDQVARLEAGVWLAEGKSSPAKVVPLGRNPRQNETILEMTIFEGRNREIRRVFAAIGLKVRRLLRLSIGPLEVGDLKPGEAREVQRNQLGFVDDALRLYEANREAWDAELPPPRRLARGRAWRRGSRPALRRGPGPARPRRGAGAARGRGPAPAVAPSRRPPRPRSARLGPRPGPGRGRGTRRPRGPWWLSAAAPCRRGAGVPCAALRP
ncbi:MAG: pseudouridine synthase [Planctomycetia bacterium]